MTDLRSIALIRDAFHSFMRRDYVSLSNDLSVTELIDHPRPIALRKRHKQELFELPITDEEVRNSMKAFIGTAIHSQIASSLFGYLRSFPNSGWLIERKIWDKIAGRRVVGKLDAFINGCLIDLKTCSVWKYIHKQFDEVEKQLNIYAYILREEEITVSMLMSVLWFQDFDADRARTQVDYPKDVIVPISLPLWSPKDAEERIIAMVERHKVNEQLPDDQLELCTEKDVWAKVTKYAVQEKGATRAVRLLDTLEEAKQYIRDSKNKNKDRWSIIKRPGERTRCVHYCRANLFCNQYKQYMQEKGENNG